MFEASKQVAMTGFIKVPASQVSTVEALSGAEGVFVRCVARHREVTEGAPRKVSWVHRNTDEAGPDYLRRVLAMRDTKVCLGIIRRRGEGAALGLVGQMVGEGDNEASAMWR
eukprot:7339507-Alexandrium_andersonii.AAC.1